MSRASRSSRLLLAGLAGVALVLGSCALTKRNLEPPTATLKGVTPEALGRDGQVFRCRLLLENPNTEDLKVVGGRVTLELAGIKAASATPMENFLLPGLAAKEVDMRVTMALLSGLSGTTELDYTLKGYVDLDVKALGRLPFKSTGKVTLDNLLRQVPGLVSPAPPAPADG
ncbi:MAG: hypothetical protein EXR82_06975 [Gammaproteobacteria bacterium]|nr:hypothetical protein [Gammaproteobacteria bacterium]